MSSIRLSRAFARPVGVLSVLSVVVAGLVSTPVAQAVKLAAPPKSARTVGEATQLAARYQTAVEVEEKTSEYVRTVATPQGTLSSELSNEPVRVRRDGGWVAVDQTLAARADGTIAPKAAPTDVAFSGGGTGSLVKYQQDGNTFELKSPWNLPAPTLQGAKATYSAVLPGVDLVVEATALGFSYNLVVLSREAAANPALKNVTFPVSTQHLELRSKQPGRPSYVDGKGREVLTVGEPLMWDSSGSAGKLTKTAAAAVGEGPTGQAKRAVMAFAGSARGLTLTPDRKLLTAPDTVFPVVIDPTMTGSARKTGWTAAWELYPTTSFWNTSHSLGVGYEGFEQHKIVRSFFQFDVASFTSKKILAASLRTYEIHSASCAARGVILSRTAAIGSGTTWNKQPARQADVATANVAKGYNSSCPAGSVEFNVTNSVQTTSTANGKVATFGLRASSETDAIGWKQFDSTGVLTIEYIAYPLPATELGVATATDSPGGCAPSNNPTIVASLKPQLSAKGRVGAGDSSARIFVQFLIVNPSQQTVTLNGPTVSPGVMVKMSPTGNLAQNVLYTYHARTVYNYPGDQLISAWSPSCYFKIDTTAPPPPTITASYNGQPLTDCLTTSTPDVCPEVVPFGAKVTYTISSTSTDVTAMSYGLDAKKMTKVNGRSVTFSQLTPAQGWMTMTAISHDPAAHISPTRYHRINVGPGLPPAASWSFDDGTGADSSGNNHPLTVTTADFDSRGRVGGSLVFDGGNGGSDRATVATPVVDTSANFSMSAWARPTSLGDQGVVALTGKNGNGGLIRYSYSAKRWIFVQTVSDTLAAPQARVESLQPPVLNAWTHLLAVFDAGNKSMTLYVNGTWQNTVTFTHTPWKATGTTEVGSYRVGTGIGVFQGAIDDVKIYNRVLSAAEAVAAANPRTGPSGSDEPVAGLSAEYPFDTVATGTDSISRTPDTFHGADLTTSGFGADPTAAITEDEERGKVLTTTGDGGETVSLDRPVVDASGSFTVTAWVKLSDTTKPRVIVRQAGTTKDSWRLEYKPTTGDEAVWSFSRSSADSAAGVVTEVTQPTTLSTADEWTALVGQYDAATDQIILKIGDRSGDDSLAPFTSPVMTGSTVVTGPPATTGTSLPFAGSMDDLRVYAGVVPQHQLCTDLGDETSCA